MVFREREADTPQEVVEMFADYFEGLYIRRGDVGFQCKEWAEADDV